jgi:protein-L-isoaspartate O-methyltransferase
VVRLSGSAIARAAAGLALLAALAPGCAAPDSAERAAPQTLGAPDVRYEPTPHAVVRQMLRLAEVGPGDVVYDLGSGDGRIPITAAREFGARGVGIEIDPALVRRAQANLREAGVADRVAFRHADLFEAEIGEATVVTLFLYPDVNLRLRPKLLAELRPGTRVVSYWHDMGDWKPDKIDSARRAAIYLWRIPPRAGQ